MASCAVLLVVALIAVVGCKGASWVKVNEEHVYPRYSNCFAAVKGRLVLIGGKIRTGEEPKPVEIWNPDNSTWTTMTVPPFNEIHHLQCPTLGTKVVVGCGYYGRVDPLSHVPDVWLYEPGNDTWVNLTRFPPERLRGSCGAFTYRKRIYYVAGSIGHGMGDVSVTWFDEFDPKTNVWSQLPDAPNRRDHFAVYRKGSKVYLIGGRDSQAPQFLSVESARKMIDIYDFQTGTWTSTPDILPPPGHAGCGVAGIGRKIIVAGGEIDNPDETSSIKAISFPFAHRIIPGSGSVSVTEISNMTIARNAPGCAACGQSVYCAGGAPLNYIEYYVLRRSKPECSSDVTYWS